MKLTLMVTRASQQPTRVFTLTAASWGVSWKMEAHLHWFLRVIL